MTPERPPTKSPAELDDRQVLDLLDDLRERAATTSRDDEAFIPAIVELELEAARRNLAVQGPHERIPARVALERFRTACERRDFEAAGKAIFYMDAAGLWYAYRRAKEQGHIAVRLHLLDRVQFCIESGVLGEERARERRARLSRATHLSDEDYEAYLVQCIDALLTVSIVNIDLPY